MNEALTDIVVAVVSGLLLAFLLGFLNLARKQPVQFSILFGLLFKICILWTVISASLVMTSRAITAGLRSGRMTLETLEAVSWTRDIAIIATPILIMALLALWAVLWEKLNSVQTEEEPQPKQPMANKAKPQRKAP